MGSRAFHCRNTRSHQSSSRRRTRPARRLLVEPLERRALLTVFVDGFDTTPDAGGCGTFANPCNTIQGGVDNAAAGDEVYVSLGLYGENVTISKSLHLRAEAGSVSIDPPAGLDGLNVNSPGGGPKIDVKIEDIAVFGAVIGIQAGSVGTLELVNVDSSDNSGDGLAVATADHVKIVDGRFDSNGDHGIIISDVSLGVHLTDDVSASLNAFEGLEVTEAPRVTIDAGKFSSNGGNGVALADISDTIRIGHHETLGLVATGNLENGIRVTDSETVTFDGPLASANFGHGIFLSTVGDVSFSNVRSTSNEEAGLNIHGASSFEDTDGVYSENKDHGLQLVDLIGNLTVNRTLATDNDHDLDGIGDGLNVTSEDTLAAVGGDLAILGASFLDTDGPGAAANQQRGVFIDVIRGDTTIRDSFHTVKSTLATGNRADGVVLLTGANATIQGGDFSSNAGSGLRLEDFVEVNVEDAFATLNGLNGLDVRLATSTTLDGGTYSHNGLDGIELAGGTAANVDDVTAEFNGEHGLHVFDQESLAVGDGDYTSNTVNGIRVLATEDVQLRDGVRAAKNLTGAHATAVDTFTDTGGTFAENVLHGLLLEEVAGDVTLTETTAENNGGEGVLAGRTSPTPAIGGDLTVKGGKFQHTDPLLPTQASGIFVDGVGGAVTFSDDPQATGNALAGVMIVDGTSASFDGGSYTDNGGPGVGLGMFSGDVSLSGLTAKLNGGPGVHVADVGDVQVEDGEYSLNAGPGLALADVGDVTTNRVVATKNATGLQADGASSLADRDSRYSTNDEHGIALLDVTGDVTLVSTTADDNDADADGTGDGFHAATSSGGPAVGGGITIRGGTFRDTDGALAAKHQAHGIFIESVAGPILVGRTEAGAGVTVTGNDAGGLAVLDGGTTATFTGGTYSSNGGDGVGLKTTSGPVTFDGVTATDNSGDGIDLSDVGDVTLTKTTATGNDPGIRVHAAASFADTDGNYSDNDDHGIQLIDILGDVTLTRTTANNNDADNNNVGDGLNAITFIRDGDAIGGDLDVRNATFLDTDGDAAGKHQENGVFVASVAGAVTFRETTARGNDKDGVDIADGGTTADFRAGSYSENDDEGIRLRSFSVGVELASLTASGNGAEGIELDFVGDAGIRDVVADDNTIDGLNVTLSRDVTITGGSYTNNHDDGIELLLVGDIRISDVTANDSGGPLLPLSVGIRATESTSLALADVTLAGNALAGGLIKDVPTVRLTTSTGNVADEVTLDSTTIAHVRAGAAQDDLEYLGVTSLEIDTDDSDDTVTVLLDGLPETVHLVGGEQADADLLAVVSADGPESLTWTDHSVTDGTTFVSYAEFEDVTIDGEGRGSTATTDVSLLGFRTAGAAGPADLVLSYEIGGAAAPAFEIGFYASADARFDASDTEIGTRLTVASASARAAGIHSLVFDQSALDAALIDLDVAFVVAVADPDKVLAETNEANNDHNFIGVFHRGTSLSPLVIRGRDDTDRQVDDANDVVRVSATGRHVNVAGSLHEITISVPRTSVSEIRAITQGGDDYVEATGRLALKAVGGAGDDTLRGGRRGNVLLGGAGNDHLTGGVSSDQLVGGAGHDTIDGLRGNDLMIGGLGSDDLIGDLGSDLVVGGRTSYDESLEMLDALLAKWLARPRRYGSRVERVTTPTGSPGADPFLAAGVTVFDDQVEDRLRGGESHDLFFADLDLADGDDDLLLDLVADESVVELGELL